jgi:hypothetical protein
MVPTGSKSIAWIAASLVGCAALDSPPAPLAGTRWQLVAIQSMDDAQGTMRPPDPARYTLEFGADGRVAVRLDCNRGSATWQAPVAGQGRPDRVAGSLLLGPATTAGPASAVRAMPGCSGTACAGGSVDPVARGALPVVGVVELTEAAARPARAGCVEVRP